MPKFFSDFFKTGPTADDFQKRVYRAISGAQNIAECYVKLYEYMIASIGWWSKTQRHTLFDNSVDISMRDDEKFNDAEPHFGDLLVLEEAVLFEYLKVNEKSQATYGPCVYSLEFDSAKIKEARKAYRQVLWYQRINIYNEEWDCEEDYHQNNLAETKALPNQKINIDPANPVDPDSTTQLAELKRVVGELETWIEQNTPQYKATVEAGDKGIYELVFTNTEFTLEDTVKGLAAMLEKIWPAQKSKSPPVRSTRNAFGRWMVGKLTEQQAFWNNPAISNAYGSINRLAAGYQEDASKYKKIVEAFNKLFADFLNGDPYDTETEDQAEQRSTDALAKLKAIFQTFTDPSGDVFEGMMDRALIKIKKDQAGKYVTSLLKALDPVPAESSVKIILPKDPRNLLKVKADEILQELPLQLDGVDVNFFVIPDYEELKAMSDNSVQILRDMEKKSSVRVNADPDEYGKQVDRPIYRTIRFGNTEDRYIAFCNLQRAVPGTFYYTRADFPAVMTIMANFHFGKTLTTIDFQNYTISYKDKVDKTKDENGLSYRELGKTSRFFEELKLISPWTTIPAVRRYDPYYTTSPTGVKDSVVHLSGFVAAGRGVSRTWPLHDDSLCLWFWNASDSDLATFSLLGQILGLPIQRRIVAASTKHLRQLDRPNKSCLVMVGGTQYTYKNYGPWQFDGNGFYFRIIGLTEMGDAEQFYVQVNTPTSGVAATLTGEKGTLDRPSRVMEDSPGAILNRFKFSYFRRITAQVNKLTRETSFSKDSKVIQLFKPDDNRKPSSSVVEEIDSPKEGFDAFGLNLPICFNLAENIIRYYKDKATRGKIINKGNVLYRAEGSRLDAGTAMKPIHPLIEPPMSHKLSASKIPATAFANGAMRQSKSQQQDWGLMKVASCNCLPISQEWCHLRGHGDGGNEYPGNFVSGSIHCNTEQLAIETGQRLVTQQMQKKSFYLYTTAYLLKDAVNYKSRTDTERKSEILSGNYLQNSKTYKDMLEMHTADRSTELTTSDGPVPKRARVDTGVQKKSPEQGDVAPVAAYIRYKVMKSEGPKTAGSGAKRLKDKVDDKRKKHFDFIFEGQSEFIDNHQFNLISQAVQFALAGEVAFQTWYEQEKAQLEAKKITT